MHIQVYFKNITNLIFFKNFKVKVYILQIKDKL